jgi:8-oxo-dGTP pyrophosphatase MutT (NUDIX family)
MTDDADTPADAEPGDANLTEKINQTNVDKRISSLEAAYDEVPVTEETFELSPDEYADVFAATRGTGYSGNSVVFVTREGTDFPELSDQIPDQAAGDTRDRVLLVLGRGADMWALPGGGKGDEYESVQGTAVRRVNEQTGIRCTVTGVAEVVHSKYYPDTEAQGSVHTLDIYLEAEYKKGALDVDESELVGAAWFAEPPERLTPGAEERFAAFLNDE